MRLLLIRHGQTPSNVLGALDTLVPGPGLTELGHRQAAAVPDALAGERITALYASSQRRAQLTAAPLAAARNLPVLVRDGLREISAGDLEMKRDGASVELYHKVSFAWADGDLTRRMPGGESGIEVFERFDGVVQEIEDAGHECAAVVAHGQMIRVWVAGRSHNLGAGFAAENPIHNTGVIVLEGSMRDGWTTLLWTGTALGGDRVDEGAGATGPGGEAD